MSQWFQSLAAPRAAPTPQIRAKANELTRNAQTESDKIQAIYDIVTLDHVPKPRPVVALENDRVVVPAFESAVVHIGSIK